MPWDIQQRDGKYHVVAEATGESVGSHTTKEGAAAHLGALYANVPEAAAKMKAIFGDEPCCGGCAEGHKCEDAADAEVLQAVAVMGDAMMLDYVKAAIGKAATGGKYG